MNAMSIQDLKAHAKNVLDEWESHNGSDGAVYLISAKALKVCALLASLREGSEPKAETEGLGAEPVEPGRLADAPNNRSTPGSAPTGEALTDKQEREAFEHAERASDLTRDTEEPSDYRNPYVQSCWEGWQKRAAVSALDYAPLHAFAEANRISYNELCAAVRAALATHPSAPVAPSTPSSHWKAEGEPDPHDSRYYDQERATLCMGNLTDDELANLAFMNYDRHLSVAEMVAGKPTPIVWMTAVKDRIRWLSRALEKALAHPPAVQPVAPAGWKPIETAPSTGAVLLAVECGGERKTFFAEQSHEQNGPCWYITTGWCGWSRLHNSWTPVAWSQIPATPSAEAQPTPKEN